MEIIAFFNQKGGVGKTTSVRNIGEILKNQKYKVLLIDLDSQATLSKNFDLELNHEYAQILLNKTFDENMIKNINGLDLMPSHIKNSKTEKLLTSEAMGELRLKKILKNLEKKYDFILIDCPPAILNLTSNALYAANWVYIPCIADKESTDGLSDLLETLEEIKEYNSNLEILGVCITKYKETNLHKAYVSILEDTFKEKLFQTKIRENITVAEAGAYNKSVVEYNKKSYGAIDYNEITKEILERLGK